MNFIFFSANNFVKEGGGTIRILGIINELAEQGHDVTLISNAQKFDSFHPEIKHTYLDFIITSKQKRVIQSVLAFCPAKVLNIMYLPLFKRLQEVFKPYKDEQIYFGEYIDNSIGYWIFKNKIIRGYINDLHGVAVLEFDFQYKSAKSIKNRTSLYLKYLGAKFLDNKVFKNAAGLIYASNAMQNYYWDSIPATQNIKSYILPYVLDKKQLNAEIDVALQQKLRQDFNIQENDKVVFFAGVFKQTGGVPDLVNAVAQLNNLNVKLLLVGDGPSFAECKEIIRSKNLQNVFLLGRIAYKDLRTYQSIANIIVCPDRQNVYSQLIIHVKYLDALLSEKVVINGAFESVKEINENEKLSLMFIPSDVNSLSKTIDKAIKNEKTLLQQYSGNIEYAKKHLTYRTAINVLVTSKV